MLADVSKMRANPERVFQTCHVDIAGPITVRGFVRTRASKKTWLIFFVCGSTSAAHVEVMGDYSSNSTLAGIIKFTNLFHMPELFVSDSGTQFPAIKKWVQAQEAEWQTVPPGAQHSNGVAERLIGIVKRNLMPVLEKQPVDLLELQVLASSAVRMANTRPIGLLKEVDDLESMSVLTPAHFIRGPYVRGPSVKIDGVSNLHRRAAEIQEMTNEIWRDWEVQVLPVLLSSSKWAKGQQQVKVGSVCFMQDVNAV